jgi:beta-N-acetylhexosaminidase
MTAGLREAARAGRHPLLVMTDQEGGAVRRFRWAPPAASAEEMGRLGEAAIRRRGRETAQALERLGVDVDLAPVADVPGVPGSFIAAQHRGFLDPLRTARRHSVLGGAADAAWRRPSHFRAQARDEVDRRRRRWISAAPRARDRLLPYRRATR